ncbi:MAG: septal ring lytic transglycosylase RlpA family protein [Nitrospirota bacterium]
MLLTLVTACTCLPKGQADLDVGVKERGVASWYGKEFDGWLTASGEPYNMEDLTGAHRTLPLGTVVRVTNVNNGRQVQVRINDRGPYVNGRILDLSYKAARRLGMVEGGTAAVSLEVVGNHGGLFSAAEHGHGVPVPLSLLSADVPQASASDMPWRDDPGPIDEARGARDFSPFPGDVMRERRLRRVADILAADRHVSVVATLLPV